MTQLTSCKPGSESVLPLENGITIRMVQQRFPRTVGVELSIELEKHAICSDEEADALVNMLIQKYDAYTIDDIIEMFC